MRALGPLLAACLVLSWIVSSLASRGKGFVVFVLLLVALAYAVAAFRRGRRQVLYTFAYLLLLAAAAGGAVEIALTLKPDLIGGPVANVAYTGYHWQRGGIYDLDRNAGPVLRPSVRRRMYWSGHQWGHETNALGFRGPARDRADAVFLGDSMIYGHGVDEPDTVSARFGRATGLAAANLGQQGTCLLQAYMTFLRRGLALRPRWVFVCAHPTDIDETLRYYDESELQRFVESSPESEALPLVRPTYRPPGWWNPIGLWSRHVALPTDLGAVLGAVARAKRETGRFVSRDPFVPSEAEREAVPPGLGGEGPPPERLAWRTQARALARLKRSCDGIGARLVVFDLGYPRAFSAAVEEQAREIGAEFSPAGRICLQHSLSGERMYLANDGHWTGEGAARVAAELARVLEGAPGAPPTI